MLLGTDKQLALGAPLGLRPTLYPTSPKLFVFALELLKGGLLGLLSISDGRRMTLSGSGIPGAGLCSGSLTGNNGRDGGTDGESIGRRKRVPWMVTRGERGPAMGAGRERVLGMVTGVSARESRPRLLGGKLWEC